MMQKNYGYLARPFCLPYSVGTYEFSARIGDYNPNAPEQCIDSDSFDFFMIE